MQFRLNKTEMLKELNLLQGVVEKKNTIPILSNVLIETMGESMISLIATDLDVSLRTQCTADVTQPGPVVIQAKKLFEIVRNLPDAEIQFLKEENDWVKIICGSSEFKVVGQAKEHFPSTPESEDVGLAISAALLNNLISRTVFAITQEESRYALNGSLFSLTGETIQLVSTDGFRLAIASTVIDNSSVQSPSDEVKVIIPKKALTELMKLTSGSEETLEFSKDDNHLFFKLGHRHLTTRMLAGQFPNYDLVLPKNNDKVVPLNTEKIMQAIRRAALMADERSHGVKFALSSGRLDITSQSADVGEAKEVIPIDYEGEGMSIGFNAQYLLDFLNVVGSEEVIFEFKDEQSPALMRPSVNNGFDYRCVIMPMRLL